MNEYSNNLKKIVKQLELCNYQTSDNHYLKMNIAFIELKKLSETTILPMYQLTDKVWVMNKGRILQVEITSIKVTYGTVAQGSIYTTKLVEDSKTWFDGGTYSENQLFLTKEELLKTL